MIDEHNETHTLTIGGVSGTGTITDDATEIAFAANPGVVLVKSATLNDDDGITGVSAGDTIDYAFTVTNTGSVTLANISVTDPLVTVAGGPLASLVPGASGSATFTARYVVTNADVVAGSVYNQASVSATAPRGGNASDLSGTARDSDEATVTYLGSISGRVADMQGNLAGAIVRLIDARTGQILREITTDAEGNYSFIGLEPGSFCISFVHDAGDSVLSTAGKSDGADATGDQVCGLQITPGAGGPISGVDAVMIDPSGVIYDAVTRAPIAGATVPDSWLASSGDHNGVVTEADGRYAFLLQAPAQTGVYRMQVTAPGYVASTLVPARPGVLAPDRGLGGDAVVPFAHAPASGEDTTHYLAFRMVFPDWTDASTLSKGNRSQPYSAVSIRGCLATDAVAYGRDLGPVDPRAAGRQDRLAHHRAKPRRAADDLGADDRHSGQRCDLAARVGGD